MKYWGMSFNEVLELSYINFIMLNSSIPVYDKDGNKIETPAEITGKDFITRLKNK